MSEDTLRAIIVIVTTLLGGGGAFGLWKLMTTDFLRPYRHDLTTLRDMVDRAEKKAAKAERKADWAVSNSRNCEAREAWLRLEFIKQGIQIPPYPPHLHQEPYIEAPEDEDGDTE